MWWSALSKACGNAGYRWSTTALVVLGLGLLAASGCVSQSPKLIAPYVVSGKAVIRSPQGSQRFNFRWQQAKNQYSVSVWGALGMGRLQLSGTEQAMVVSRIDQAPATGPAAQMMEQYLGWSMPLEAMGAWLLGKPASTLAQVPVIADERGRITRLNQEGWLIEFSQFELWEGEWRPKRLDITATQISMRLVLSLPRPVMGS